MARTTPVLATRLVGGLGRITLKHLDLAHVGNTLDAALAYLTPAARHEIEVAVAQPLVHALTHTVISGRMSGNG
jgi:hypothetical protein